MIPLAPENARTEVMEKWARALISLLPLPCEARREGLYTRKHIHGSRGKYPTCQTSSGGGTANVDEKRLRSKGGIRVEWRAGDFERKGNGGTYEGRKEGLISPIYIKSFSQQGYGPDRDEARRAWATTCATRSNGFSRCHTFVTSAEESWAWAIRMS